MKKKLTLITLTMTILLCGLIISCDLKPSGNDYVGTWIETDSKVKLKITKVSDNTFSIEKSIAKGNIIGELKEGVLIANPPDGTFTYSLKDGEITEITPKDTGKYKKEK